MGVWGRTLAVALVLFATAASANGLRIGEALRLTLESGETASSVTGGDRLLHRRALLHFYRKRGFEPFWMTDAGRPRQIERIAAVLRAVRDSRREGLEPRDYHGSALQALFGDDPSGERARPVPAELLLSDAVLALASDYASGRVDPRAVDAELAPSQRPDAGLAALTSVAAGASVADAVRARLPSTPQYIALREQLVHYRRLAEGGGWPRVPPGPPLRVGDRGPRVDRLLDRLRVEGFAVGPGDVFNETTASAVRAFQVSRGLAPDAVVGRNTLVALNTSAADIVRSLRVNLERWRWLPDDLGANHVFVNIADYRVDLFLEGRRVHSYAAVVGRSYFRTPVFSDRIRYLVLNPGWDVPPGIAEDEILPHIQKDPAYLQNAGFQVLSGWGADERVVDPGEIDWAELGPGRFPYRLRQRPGPENPLGQVKFMFPNAFNVYLHDTPAKSLFEHKARAFSHGCIRVADALDLARRVLAAGGRPEVADRLEQALSAGGEQRIVLSDPIPIQIVYLTAFVDSEGILQLRPDIYGRDPRILAALVAPRR